MSLQSHQPIAGTVLVADDQAANRELLEEILSTEGCKVITAPDGAAALEELTRTQSDHGASTADLGMPLLERREKGRTRYYFKIQ
jgi:CheY-like chemotaxis protein